MRICLVTPYDLSHDGGVNRHVLSLAHALRLDGDRVRILGPASGSVPRSCFGLRGVVAVAANGSTARVGLFVARRAVRRFLRAGRFDIVHVHEPWLPGIARHAVRLSTAPVVGTFHCYADSPTLATRMARRALARPARRMVAALAVSTAAAEFARSVFRGPTHVVPNGIDTGRFTTFGSRAAAADPSALARALRVLFVGRYDEPRKGLMHLLEAVAQLRARGGAVELTVVGTGGGCADWRLVRAAGARFVGRLSDAALANAYRDADVFCAPSVYGESFGLVLVEAMACGCPVVASDIRGYREAAAGAALLVHPGEPAAIVAALERVRNDVGLRRELIARGHRRAHTLSWDRLIDDVRRVYRVAANASPLERTAFA